MTDREKAIVMAYTGVCMLSGDKFKIFHEYVENIMGRPVYTHEMGIRSIADAITEKAKADFIALCAEQEPTTKNDLGVDCISRADAIKAMQNKAKKLKNEDTINGLCGAVAILYEMPTVTPQEPKTGYCRDCKWWKDSDGAYRRGTGAESQCPINRKEVFEGEGYCYMFEPQESED